MIIRSKMILYEDSQEENQSIHYKDNRILWKKDYCCLTLIIVIAMLLE